MLAEGSGDAFDIVCAPMNGDRMHGVNHCRQPQPLPGTECLVRRVERARSSQPGALGISLREASVQNNDPRVHLSYVSWVDGLNGTPAGAVEMRVSRELNAFK